jgi:catechol 2,3-dioxygenase-like lactoylglutathione lyase family enzyme
MKLAYTILYVEDVGRSLDFYAKAFDLKIRYRHESGDFGELETGNTALAFSSRRLMTELQKNPSRADAKAPSFEIAFATDDVAAGVTRALATGATLIQKPAQMPWGQTVAYVADPDGFLVEICTPMAA